MTAAAARGLDATLAALADPHRRQVVELLRDGPRPAGELARALGVTPPAMSRHLRMLKTSISVREISRLRTCLTSSRTRIAAREGKCSAM